MGKVPHIAVLQGQAALGQITDNVAGCEFALMQGVSGIAEDCQSVGHTRGQPFRIRGFWKERPSTLHTTAFVARSVKRGRMLENVGDHRGGSGEDDVMG